MRNRVLELMFVCNFPPDSSLFTGSFIGNPAFPLNISSMTIVYERYDIVYNFPYLIQIKTSIWMVEEEGEPLDGN